VTLARPARHILPALLLGALATLAAPQLAHAEEQPTAEQLEQAKKAYAEGKAKFEKGNFGDAVEKFKESYRLSKNPLLLFNIAVTFERLQQNDMALFYYKKFLSDAPEGAAQRADAKKSVAALEKAGTKPASGDAAEAPPSVEAPAEPEAVATTEEPPAEVPERKKRPAAECVEADIEHQIVEDAPPGKPLDLTASVPEECGWTVTLFYRGHGDDKFLNAAMRPRYRELVGRIPAAKMSGNAVQYYVEVKATDGALVKRIGKSTSPNVVYLDEAAQPRFYPDLDESGGTDEATGRTNAYSTGDEEDPLAPKGPKRVAEVPALSSRSG
jgi:tetratricopeptide (TPR) repeat protein